MSCDVPQSCHEQASTKSITSCVGVLQFSHVVLLAGIFWDDHEKGYVIVKQLDVHNVALDYACPFWIGFYYCRILCAVCTYIYILGCRFGHFSFFCFFNHFYFP